MRVSRRGFLATTGFCGIGAAVAGDLSVLGPSDARTDARALVAGSLLSLAEAVPGASVEAHGSLTVRRLLLDGARDPDVVALADPDLFAGIADAPTLFVTNALVLAYNPDSAFADAIEADWARALARDDVRVGRTDPAADPLGYRTVLALDLAARSGLADPSLLDESRVFPETALMQNLELGALDAAFAYENMAIGHDLPFVALPAAIDFSDPSRADEYATVSLDLPGRTVSGAPIRYAATPLTDTGREWFESLVGATRRLRAYGFSVPEDYPATL